jgi:hypothetical protein
MSWPKIFKSRANARREKMKEQGQIFAEEMKREQHHSSHPWYL